MKTHSRRIRPQHSRYWTGPWCLLLALALVGPCHASSLASEAQDRSVICSYDLKAGDKTIGNIRSTRTATGDGDQTLWQTEVATAIELSGLWGAWSMTSNGLFERDSKGLRRFALRIAENDKRWRIEGERSAQELRCSAENGDQDEQKAAPGPLAEGGGKLRIPLGSFDTTDSELPGFLLQRRRQPQPMTAKVLDTGELTIKCLLFEETGREQIALAGKTFECDVFKTKAPNEQTVYWIAEDALGAFLVKETGMDDDEPYEIVLKSYRAGRMATGPAR